MPEQSLRPRQVELLAVIEEAGGQWTTRRVMDVRRASGSRDTQRSTARHDLHDLARLGHLVLCDQLNDRYYLRSSR